MVSVSVFTAAPIAFDVIVISLLRCRLESICTDAYLITIVISTYIDACGRSPQIIYTNYSYVMLELL